MPNWLKNVFIIGVVCFVAGMVIKNINLKTSKLLPKVKTSANANVQFLPREVAGIPVIVTLEPKRVIRIYEGDVFKYQSPHGFWVKGESDPPYFHNPSNERCKKREFEFYDVKKGGENIYIYRDKNTSPENFELRFWVEQG